MQRPTPKSTKQFLACPVGYNFVEFPASALVPCGVPDPIRRPVWPAMSLQYTSAIQEKSEDKASRQHHGITGGKRNIGTKTKSLMRIYMNLL